MSIGQNIKAIRKERNKTQKEFAEILDISPSYMSELENDKRNLSLETISNLAKKMDVSFLYLLEGKTTFDDLKRIYNINKEDKLSSLSLEEAVSSAENDVTNQVYANSLYFIENYNEYTKEEISTMHSLNDLIEKLRYLEKTNYDLADETRKFLNKFLFHLYTRINVEEDNPSELINVYNKISELILDYDRSNMFDDKK
ncbi:helix-turn-helix domain-containing protein [Tetragenococcus koreensis]|uniref:helix-turn-helix domain-containing protein n=1 Tax=Tetragenococcus koreensis TaxID=290335 RepID=UPI001F3776D4|nr:helix-turn-helix transcriptional regulator [Tetragenococcus koreensis]MCF1625861.1 helix-turn-helix transcriptional regulator [Tetragenococcus koreensis]